jgi:Pentapeptide repeats (8 copies)
MDITQLKAQYKAGERNFSGAKLSGVSLVWVELVGVNFEGADLSHANLSAANLSESNFSGEANLTFADLSRADLRNANLRGTRLEGANLEGIQLEGAVYDEATRFPLGFDPIKAKAVATGALLQPVVAVVTEQAEPSTEDDLEQHVTRERPKLREKEAPKSQKTPPRIFGPKPTIETAKEIFQKARSATVDAVKDEPIIDRAKQLFQKGRSATVEAINDWQETKPSNWVSAQSTQTMSPQEVFTLNTSGQGKSSVVPATIQGSVNWGALLLPWIWFLPNRVWGGLWLWLFALIPQWGTMITVVFAIAMAAYGNTWAWQSRKWNSVEAFKKHQRGWAIAGLILWGLGIFISLASQK